MVVGALPFDLSTRPALFFERIEVPQACRTGRCAPPAVLSRETLLPTGSEHRARVAGGGAAAGSALEQVVLARARLNADAAWDPRSVLRRFGRRRSYHRVPGRVGTAGAGGRQPELLVARTGDLVICRPFAGSAPRSPDPQTDAANAAALAASGKNRREHAFVVDVMRGTGTAVRESPQIADERAAQHRRYGT